MNKIGIGRTAEVFLDDDGSAVKLFYDWMPADATEREASILQRISDACPLAPKFCETIRVEGRSGLRFEYIGGKMAAQLLFERPLDFRKTVHRISRLHREIHSAQANGLRTAQDVYGPALSEVGGLDGKTRDMLLDFLRGRSVQALCHGDFHPENVLEESGGRLRVIDWVNAYTGDPLSDVARSYYLMRYGRSPNKLNVFKRTLESIARPLLSGAYLQGYFEGQEFPEEDFRRWLLIIMIHRWVRERIDVEAPSLKRAILRYQSLLSKVKGQLT